MIDLFLIDHNLFCFLQANNEEDLFLTDTEKETADSTINSPTVASKFTV